MTTRTRKRLVREAKQATNLLELRKAGLQSAHARLIEAGRVLSAANEEKIRAAAASLADVLAALEKPDEASEAAEPEAKCPTCEGEGKIREGNVECPDCGGSGLAKDIKKEARRARLLGLAEAYSAASDDAADGAYIIAALLDLMSEESDEPGELSILQGAYTLLVQWMQLEVASIGSPDDVADSAVEPMDMWGWEAARKKLKASGGIRLKAADAPADGPASGFVPAPYTADPDETVKCPVCGLMNSPDAHFCDQCGAELAGSTATVGEARRLKTDLIPIRESAVREDGSGAIKIIEPGWGSSGYYAPDVLERDGPQVFVAGTKMFWDHPTLSEEFERPERSLRDLAAETTSDATWDPSGPEGAGLYANVKVFEQFAPVVNELAPSIGVSIRAYGKASMGEAEGQSGQIIEELVGVESIDFVTFPGAGGQVLQLFEAARQRLGNPTPEEANMTVETDPKFVEVSRRAARAEEALAQVAAEKIVTAKLAEARLPEATRTRLAASLAVNPPAVNGKLDAPALDKRIEEAIKGEVEYLATLSEAGVIKGMGPGGGAENEDLTPQLEGAFKRLGHTDAAAKIAAAGRSK